MPSGDWIDRTIRGPEKEYLSFEEFGRLFGGMSTDTLDRLVKSGEIPGPIEMSKKVRVFTWEHVVYYTLRIKLRPYFAAVGKSEKVRPADPASDPDDDG